MKKLNNTFIELTGRYEKLFLHQPDEIVTLLVNVRDISYIQLVFVNEPPVPYDYVFINIGSPADYNSRKFYPIGIDYNELKEKITNALSKS